jgi:UDP-GlcNAc:undecaprenyl-phosphate GlcNAc-1-phosphate transferase
MDIGHSHRQAVLLMYLWSALVSGCALAVAFIDGRVLVSAIVVGAVLVAIVLPRLIRDRSPRGSDRPVARANGAGAHRRRSRGAPLAASGAAQDGPAETDGATATAPARDAP